tara:strand:+ start:821 stop:1846 length:1026 start_codon:yes stop_codon:yes gene_type:complete
MERTSQRRLPTRVIVYAVLGSLLLHAPLIWWYLESTFWNEDEPPPAPLTVQLLPAEQPAEPAQDPAKPDELHGQIVEIAPPEDSSRPEQADFLAEYNSTVAEETVDRRYRNDRKITAPSYSPDDVFELEESQRTESPTAASSGATAGREVFQPGRFSLFPDRHSPFDFSNKQGLDLPAPASHQQSRMAGSPSNDHLPQVASADRTALNAHEFLYASFWNRVKQLVSFYADQTLANARPSRPLRSPRYEMVLSGAIATDGRLLTIEIDRSSGVPEWDNAVKEAFRLAAPFPDPPEGAADPGTGYIPIRRFGFVITVGGAHAEMSGIDPRQGVEFPGLQTLPR